MLDPPSLPLKTLSDKNIIAVLGLVCYFGVRAKHTPFADIFSLIKKNISRAKLQSLLFCVCLLEVYIMLDYLTAH